MKRITLLVTILTVFVLGSSVVLARGEGQGKGKAGNAAGAVEKVKEKAAKETTSTEDAVKAQKEKAEKTAASRKEKAEADVKAAKEKVEKEKKAAEETAEAQKEKTEKDVKAAKEKGAKESEAQEADDDGGKGKGKDKAQKVAALEKQVGHEAEKHANRQARLQEMLKVAQEKGDEKAIGRVQKLIDKENARYEKKSGKMAERATKGGDAAVEKEAEKSNDK